LFVLALTLQHSLNKTSSRLEAFALINKKQNKYA